jgi:hypothetical protein
MKDIYALAIFILCVIVFSVFVYFDQKDDAKVESNLQSLLEEVNNKSKKIDQLSAKIDNEITDGYGVAPYNRYSNYPLSYSSPYAHSGFRHPALNYNRRGRRGRRYGGRRKI